jgi:hypothetical protein
MGNEDILRRIHDLVDEEHRLRGDGAGLTDDERARLDSLEAQLDALWDLLRRRDARREAGLDPDGPAEDAFWREEPSRR